MSLSLVFTFLLYTCHGDAAEVVSRPVGATTNSAVTSREVVINSVVESILYPSSSGPSAIKVLRTQDSEFPQAVTAVLLELVISLEADAFKVGVPTATEIQSALAQVKTKAKNVNGWSALEASDRELTQAITRKIKAKNFIRFKTESTQVSITDPEARDYFEKNKNKFGNLPFSQFRDNIKTFLAKQQMDQRLREWFEVLKKKYAVRNLELDKTP